jgi:hypothetical protein
MYHGSRLMLRDQTVPFQYEDTEEAQTARGVKVLQTRIVRELVRYIIQMTYQVRW